MANLPAQSSPVYATDEDIAVRAGGDWFLLCPAWQSMAAGTDGTFGIGTPWVLTSPSTDFGASGVTPNQVVQLSGGTPPGSFRGSGQLLAVDSVAGTSITLRRFHKDVAIGQPPSPSGGLSAVSFVINTLDPQIEEASFEIKRRYGIDENLVRRSSTWIYDLRDLRMATILTVLKDRYAAEVRVERGDWSYKINLIRSQLDNVLDRVQVRWGPSGSSAESSTIFNTRVSR